MNNKQQIQKLRDNAELAWAAYGYYDLITNDTNQSFMVLKDEKGKDKMDSNGNPMTKQVNLIDIMDITYGYYDLITNDTNQSFMVLKDEKGKDKMDSNGNPMTKQVNLIDIMDITYKDYKVYKPSCLPTLKPDELDSLGDIEIEKYSNPRYDSFIGCYFNTIKKDKGKWYERVYPSILDSNFKEIV